MTRERLEGLPISALLDLAQKEEIDIDPGITREELIEELLETYEEEQREREALNNLIIKIEQSKFSLLSDDIMPTQEIPILPETYDENKVSLVLRDPTWALIIWEIRRFDRENLELEYGFKGFQLKIFERELLSHKVLNQFTIPVTQAIGTQYIHLPTPEREYSLDLSVVFEKEIRVLAKSCIVEAPCDEFPYSKEYEEDDKKRQLLDLSGLAFCEPMTAKKESERIQPANPHRIGMDDEAAFEELSS